MLLLAPELLAIELCVGAAGSELKSFETIDGVNVAKQYGAVRVGAAVWAMSLCGVWPALALSCGEPASHLLRTSIVVDAHRSLRSGCVGRTVRTGSGPWSVGSGVRRRAVRSAYVLPCSTYGAVSLSGVGSIW
jgi:hypothetical protein